MSLSDQFSRRQQRRVAAAKPGNLLRRFRDDENGDVLILFGLLALSMFTLVGAAVDLGRWLNARDQTIAAIDAAILAAGRAIQTGATNAQAQTLALQYYHSNTQQRISVSEDTVSFNVSQDRLTVKTAGSVKINTPFLRLVHIDNLPLFTQDEAPEATTAQQDTLKTNREIALMLDVSGSMCSPCTKRDDMKAAAADLVNIVIKDTPSDYWTKVAVIPFSGDVRPPSSMLGSITNGPATRDFTTTSGSGKSKTTTTYSYKKTACVAERKGSEKHEDTIATSPDFVMNTYVYPPKSTATASSLCSTPVSGTVLPLTSSKSTVLASINSLTTGGGTAGHIGTAWSYYMLSPKWAPILPDVSKPQPYNTDKLKKTAILMTDGEFNFTYDANGVAVGDTFAGPSANGNSSAAQAVAICNQMKQDGIEVYTVGFDLADNNAINTLKNCASDSEKAYLAANGEALKQVFRDIAVRLTELHLLK